MKIFGGFKEVKLRSFTEYKVEFSSEEPFEVDLTGNQIKKQGFESDISIEKVMSDQKRTVYKLGFHNIKGNVNDNCSFSILAKTAKGASGSVSYMTSSNSFKLVDHDVDTSEVEYKVYGPSEQQIINGGAVSYNIKFNSSQI